MKQCRARQKILETCRMICGLLLLASYAPSASSIDLFGSESQRTPGPVYLEVAEPYIEMHTGPGRGYPVFNVVEQGETIEIIKRKAEWYKVRSSDNKLGWSKASEIAHTLKPSGEPVDLPEINRGDYLKSRWRVGFSGGQFEGANAFSVTGGYRFLGWLGAELEWGQIFDNSVTSDYYGANILLEPDFNFAVTPYVSGGAGQFHFDNRQKVVVEDAGNSDYYSVGVGASYYIGRNFVMRGEYRWYSVSTDDGNAGLNSWRIGLNTFF
jgi:opacity protein-like surface antigen